MTTRSGVTPHAGGAVGAVGLPLELLGRVRVGADRDPQAGLDRLGQDPFGRIEPLGPAVDLERGVELPARLDDHVVVERRLRPAPPDEQPAGAVAEDVDVRAGDRRDHAPGHLSALHAQLRVHARDHHVDAGQQLLVLVERAVFQDVDLDAGEDPERREVVVERVHDLELLAQTVGREPVGDLEARRVVGEREVLVPEVAGLAGHRRDRVAAVGPVGVGVQIALQLRAQRLARVGAGLGHLVEQLLEVGRRIAVERLDDHRRGLLADPGDVGEPPVVHEAAELVVGDQRHFARGTAKGLHADMTARAPRISSSAIRSSASTGVTPETVPVGRPAGRSYTPMPEG